jgi:hypothetical protein
VRGAATARDRQGRALDGKSNIQHRARPFFAFYRRDNICRKHHPEPSRLRPAVVQDMHAAFGETFEFGPIKSALNPPGLHPFPEYGIKTITRAKATPRNRQLSKAIDCAAPPSLLNIGIQAEKEYSLVFSRLAAIRSQLS